jgi:hypothetical protein
MLGKRIKELDTKNTEDNNSRKLQEEFRSSIFVYAISRPSIKDNNYP